MAYGVLSFAGLSTCIRADKILQNVVTCPCFILENTIEWTTYYKLWYVVPEKHTLASYIAYETVHEIATEQHGLIKASQATEHGVAAKTLVAMAARGRLERVGYGLYRDRRVPENRWTPFMAAALWPHGTIGLLTGETVLSLLELSDVNPAAIHITVPANFRARRRQPPPGVVLHHADVPPADRMAIEGIPATTVARAIRTCAQAEIGPALLRQAVEDARKAGWLTPIEERELVRDLTAASQL